MVKVTFGYDDEDLFIQEVETDDVQAAFNEAKALQTAIAEAIMAAGHFKPWWPRIQPTSIAIEARRLEARGPRS